MTDLIPTVPVPDFIQHPDYQTPKQLVTAHIKYESYQLLRRYWWALEKSAPGLDPSLSEATRYVIERGLEVLTAELGAIGVTLPETAIGRYAGLAEPAAETHEEKP